MKGKRFYLGFLAAVPSHAFVVLPATSSTQLPKTLTCGNRFALRALPVGDARTEIWRRSGQSRSLVMETPNFAKTLAAVLIIGSTVGASAIPFMSIGPQSSGPKTVRVVDEDGQVTERGTFTGLTRPEIQKKLAQIPVFFLRDDSGAVYVENGEGVFFMSPTDAKAKLGDVKGADGIKIAATTLDDIWFPLIKKKGPNKKPVAAQASLFSDLSARYKIIPRSNQVSQAVETTGWNVVGDKDGVPVWAADTLAFRGTGSKLKIPLFTNVDDLMTSWERLKTEAGSDSKAPTIQVSSIGAIIDVMERGGGDNRNLEFFADMDAIEQAEKLL